MIIKIETDDFVHLSIINKYFYIEEDTGFLLSSYVIFQMELLSICDGFLGAFVPLLLGEDDNIKEIYRKGSKQIIVIPSLQSSWLSQLLL